MYSYIRYACTRALVANAARAHIRYICIIVQYICTCMDIHLCECIKLKHSVTGVGVDDQRRRDLLASP